MGDWATLLTALAAVITGVGSSVAGVITALRRTSPRERERAAKEVVDELLDAAADGVLTDEEIRRLRQVRDDQHRKELGE